MGKCIGAQERSHMKQVGLVALCLLAIPSGASTAQALDSALAYFPMSIGNQWQYAEYIAYVSPGTLRGYRTLTVTGDTVMSNGKAYRILVQGPSLFNTAPFSPFNPTYLRMDSARANLYEGVAQVVGGERVWDSLLARPGDRSPWGLVSIRRDTIFGVPTVSKTSRGE
jgi:hypothetical protein